MLVISERMRLAKQPNVWVVNEKGEFRSNVARRSPESILSPTAARWR